MYDPRIVPGARLLVYEPNEFVNREPTWPEVGTRIEIEVGRLSAKEGVRSDWMKFFHNGRERYTAARTLVVLEELSPPGSSRPAPGQG